MQAHNIYTILLEVNAANYKLSKDSPQFTTHVSPSWYDVRLLRESDNADDENVLSDFEEELEVPEGTFEGIDT